MRASGHQQSHLPEIVPQCAFIRDVTIYHGGHFAILVSGCTDLTGDNVTMDTDRDGIDIDCCRNQRW